MSSASLRRLDGDPVAIPPATPWSSPLRTGAHHAAGRVYMDEDLRPNEKARAERRDRKARAKHRAGMRTGLLKTMIASFRAQEKRDRERTKKGEK